MQLTFTDETHTNEIKAKAQEAAWRFVRDGESIKLLHSFYTNGARRSIHPFNHAHSPYNTPITTLIEHEDYNVYRPIHFKVYARGDAASAASLNLNDEWDFSEELLPAIWRTYNEYQRQYMHRVLPAGSSISHSLHMSPEMQAFFKIFFQKVRKLRTQRAELEAARIETYKDYQECYGLFPVTFNSPICESCGTVNSYPDYDNWDDILHEEFDLGYEDPQEILAVQAVQSWPRYSDWDPQELLYMSFPNLNWRVSLCWSCFMHSRIAYCAQHDGAVLMLIRDGWENYSCPSCSVPLFRHLSENVTGYSRVIRNYSYKPNWSFFSTPDEPKEPNPKTLFMGMEIETSFGGGGWSRDYGSMIDELYETHPDLPKGFIFGKSDASVSNGVELVTHPFTKKWAEKNFPYAWFDSLINSWGAIPSHSSCGAHVHVARSSFSESHLWKFLALHTELYELLGIYGRRGTGAEYGRLNTDFLRRLKTDSNKLTYVKQGPGGLSRKGLYPERSGVNLGTSTIELRYPAGASSPKLIRTNMQMVQAIYDFTKAVSVKHVREGVLKDAGYMLGWVKDNAEKYPDLLALQEQKLPTPKTLN